MSVKMVLSIVYRSESIVWVLAHAKYIDLAWASKRKASISRLKKKANLYYLIT